MNAQEYYLNIRPGDGYPQTVKVSQGDVGRPLLFHLMDGVNPLSIPAGATITIHGTKPSGLGFTETCTVSGSSAAISTTLAITQEYGLFPAELVVSANDDIIATANFSLYVERNPHPDGTTDGTKEELDDLYTEVANLKNEISELGGLSDDVKQALLQIAAKAVYVDDGGPQYYQNLYDALYPPAQTYTVTNTLTGCTTNNAAASVTENAPYSATITASSGYSLTGATVSITMGGTDITATAYNNGTISIASVTGNLIITVTAVAVTLSSISAVYTQSGTVYDTDTLDSLKTDLVVTATWSDSSTTTVDSADYTLSGTLTVGTSTVTVTYEGKTDTFSVTVTQDTRPWKSLSISDDFVEGTAWGSSYNSTYGQYCTANSSRCSYGKFEFYLEAGYKYTFEHDSGSSTHKFGVVSGEKTASTTSAIENHSSLSNKMPSDSGWQGSGYVMTPNVDTYVAIQFNTKAATLISSGATELRIRRETA